MNWIKAAQLFLMTVLSLIFCTALGVIFGAWILPTSGGHGLGGLGGIFIGFGTGLASGICLSIILAMKCLDACFKKTVFFLGMGVVLEAVAGFVLYSSYGW